MTTQGPNSPGTTVDDATVGNVAWTNPNNVQSNDAVYSTSTLVGPQFTHYLNATNFGFTIPTGTTINGITVESEMKKDAVDIRNLYAKIVKGGVIGTTNKATSNINEIPTTEAYETFGGSADLWGLTWTPADINASNFGFVISSQAQTGSSGTVYIDHIRITVTYTLNVPIVTTQSVTNIDITTATGNGNVTSDGGTTITERGTCWNTSTGPTTANNKFIASGTTGTFTTSLTGLSANTLYYVRSYAINSVGTSYGSEVTFTTLRQKTFTGISTITGVSTITL